MLPAHGIWRETCDNETCDNETCDNETCDNETCDNELANEWARCGGKNASYITM